MSNRVIFSIIGSTLDSGLSEKRHERWRPNVALAHHAAEMGVKRLELIYQPQFKEITDQVVADIKEIAPKLTVKLHKVDLSDAWDFENVYGSLLDVVEGYPFNPNKEEYLVHLTTGSHVMQISLFALTESRFIPGKLLQTVMGRGENKAVGRYDIVDLDISRYDKLAERFHRAQLEGLSSLKDGIDTRNALFNTLISQIERVSSSSKAPILLMGATGVGKTAMARRIYELKKERRQVKGAFIEVNCATLRGDSAMSMIFGHTKGAFTGAVKDREGLMKRADSGLLFLDEIGELGMDEQAMLLRAIEEGRFLPVGSDREEVSDFQLIAGTNRDLQQQVAEGRFREDLLARINLWSFEMPRLADRREDIEPNFDFELKRFIANSGSNITINAEARESFMRFAASPSAAWSGNFRDLNSCVTRMATLADNGRIKVEDVEAEIARLNATWGGNTSCSGGVSDSNIDKVGYRLLVKLLGEDRVEELDRFDLTQLTDVLRICANSSTLAEAGRTLFSKSRLRRTSKNDGDRLRKYLAGFEITWADITNTSRGD